MTHKALTELENIGSKNPVDGSSYNDDFIKVMDYYHTIISYFNSLKEVGKTESQIHTYIIKEIRRVFNRVIRPGKMMHGIYTYSIEKSELTGRLSGEEVKSNLEQVSSKWIPQNRFAHFDEGKSVRFGEVTPDIVMARNMIY